MLLLSVLALTGCAHKNVEVAAPLSFSVPCEVELQEIRYATHTQAAKEAVRGYLGCQIGSSERPPTNLERLVENQLGLNPYPAASRDDVHAHFFDTALLKRIPEDTGELAEAVRLLEDQALARRAMGDEQVADAAHARARKLRALGTVLDDIQS